MADKLLDIKVEDAVSSASREMSSAPYCNLATVRVKIEHEVIPGGSGVNDPGIELDGIKVEKMDIALEGAAASSSQSSNTLAKEEGAGICFDLVRKVKVEEGLSSEDRMVDPGIGTVEVGVEEPGRSSGYRTSSSENLSYFTDNGQHVETNALTKEEDLGVYCEEEEGFTGVGSDLCTSFGDKKNPICGEEEFTKTETNEGAREVSEVDSGPGEPAVSFIVNSEAVISKCDKSGLQGDPSVLPSEKPFQCVNCTARFKKRYHLQGHAVVHSSERPFACTQCSSKFKSKSSLSHHLTIHSDKRPFRCSQCSSSFKRKQTLEEHSRAHSSERPYSCAHCPATFKLKQHIRMHIKIHSYDKQFTCLHCPATFLRKDTLNQHLLTHLDEKPFVCSLCPARFAQKAHLKGHFILHSDEKPFNCTQCPARFKRKNELKRHLIIHSSEKPISCPHCSAKFSHKSYLRKHLSIH